MSSPLLPIEDIRLMLPVGDTGRISGEFSPDGKYVATVGGGPVKIWDVSSGKLIRSIDRHFNHITTAHFSPDGKYLATEYGHKMNSIIITVFALMINCLNGLLNYLNLV